MPKTEVYQLNSLMVDPLVRQEINRILLRISDRLDKLEGIRGTPTVQDGFAIENTGDIFHGFNTENEV